MMFTNPIPPRWLKGGNMETLYAKALQREAPEYRRELIRDSYGEDYAAYDFVDSHDANAPCVVLLHGLEGSSRSHYAIELMHAAHAKGWHGVVAHFRSCGGVPSKRMYHSGDTREVAHMLGVLAARYARLYVAGVSLGGNVLAKYLGEQKSAALPRAAAAVSAPLDLNACGDALEQGIPRLLYTQYFLRSLLPKVPPAAHKISSLGDFDNTFTAPLHGFADKRDYYTRSSAKPFLRDIAIPTLLLNAKNDPFVPAASLPREYDISDCVTLMQPEHGGHVAFVTGEGRGHLRWLPETLLAYFSQFETV
ncbi:alpha/beta fold hydrolase [Wielerella bovis]|uniref:YheT family hydrolase n=1 Tax=Wielerella bovis TaxID=2917790 RepID=UPI00201891EB|nr:alpha/beta fold hydrolase [Wielerella bovis]ULJ69863.1 alpha/beta fold hydrolase [Wielerella bovis]